VCHFETSSPIPADKYAHILNRSLPRDVIVISSAEADAGFHARKSAYWKTYRYQVDTGAVPDLLERRFRAHVPGRFDLDAMRRAASFLVGTHDFTSFCSTKTVVENRVRTIHRCLVEEDRLGFRIEVTGTGFLYNMVRIIAGTLAEAGRGRLSPERIPEILAARDRTKAGPTFPPEGLLLVKVGYEPWSENAPSL
jgi:tRNA pseudouridine38-40 synthase